MNISKTTSSVSSFSLQMCRQGRAKKIYVVARSREKETGAYAMPKYGKFSLLNPGAYF